MDMIRMTEAELPGGLGALAEKARHEPVTITRDGRDDLVLLSAEEYVRLKRRDRRVGLTEELSEEWIEAVRTAKVPDEFAAFDCRPAIAATAVILQQPETGAENGKAYHASCSRGWPERLR